MRKIKLLCVSSIVLAVVLLISGMSSAAPTIVVYGTTERVTDMDPANAYDFHTWEIFYNIYQGLMKYPAGSTELIPGLAESYTISEDGKEYTFNLREGIAFTDGTPFNAEAVKWSIERVMRLGGDPSWLVTDFVEAVETVDEYSVKFILKNPVAYFPALVATVPYYPVNPSMYPADDIITNPEELPGGQLTGLGPYKMVSFKRDEEIILDANTDFYGEKPKNDRVVIRYFADATTMRLALEKGELDVAFKSFNPSDISDLEKSDKIKTVKGQGPYIRYICPVHAREPFNNPVLRQAIAAAVNRPDFIQKVFLGQNEPLYSMVPMGMWTHAENFKEVYGDGNLEKARELLASQGFSEEKPFEFDLWYTPAHYGDTEVDLAAVLKDQFEATKMMKVTVKSAEWATYKENWRNQVMPIFLLGWYPDYIDPDNYTAAFAGTAGSAGNGIFFSDPEWDAMLAEAQTVSDPAKREALYAELQQRWAEDLPTIPLFQGTLYLFTRPNVEGVLISPTLQFNYGPIEVK